MVLDTEVLPSSGCLYFLNLASDATSPMMPPLTIALAAIPSFDLVHKRLAHPSKNTLQTMIKKGLVNGLDGVADESRNFTCNVHLWENDLWAFLKWAPACR